MKKLLSVMLAVAMVLTTVIIPLSVSADAVAFDGDYVKGYPVSGKFVADESNFVSSNGSTITSTTYADVKYMHAEAGTNMYGQFNIGAPAIPADGTTSLYVKFRVHAVNDAKYAHTYMYFTQPDGTGKHRITGNFTTVLPDAGIEFNTTSPGVDNIYEVTGHNYKHYAKPVGTANWIFVREGELATGGAGTFQLGHSIGISELMVYKKATMVDGDAFDFNETSIPLYTYDASIEADASKVVATTEGASVLYKTVAGEKYAYESSTGYLKFPGIYPSVPSTGATYLKFRIHANSNGDGDKHIYMYLNGGKRVTKTLKTSVIGLDFNKDNTVGMDWIVELTPSGYTYYVRSADSTGKWTVFDDGEPGEYNINSGGNYLQVRYGTAVSKAVVYKHRNPVADSVVGCADGDYVVSTFDADNEADCNKLVSTDGGPGTVADAVRYQTFNGQKYAYAAAGKWFGIPQVSVTPSSTEETYVKFRVRALTSDSGKKVAYLYMPGNLRAGIAMNSDFNFNLVPDSEAGTDVIFKLGATSFSIYERTEGGDGDWALVEENRAYEARTGQNFIHFQENVAISEAVVYKKVDAATSAFNAASKNSDATAMAAALSTYAAEYGIDAAKLNDVDNKNAVYAKLYGLNFATAAEVAAVFNKAVADQILAEFDGDYVEGNKIYKQFDASKPADLANVVTSASDASSLALETLEADGLTYVHAAATPSGVTGWMQITNFYPGVVEGETLYIKMTTHAVNNNNGDKSAYLYFPNIHRLIPNMRCDKYSEVGLSYTAEGPGMDNIFEVSDTGAWTHYARPVGSTGNWTIVGTGQTSAHTNAKMYNIQNGHAVSNILVYTKEAAEAPKATTLTKASETETAWTLKVDSNETETGTVYVGAYDARDVLLGVGIADFSAAGTTVEVAKPATGAVTYFKAFIWNNALKPLVNSIAPLNN